MKLQYYTFIRGCFKNKMYDGGCLLIDEMCAPGFKADASTTSMLFNLLQSKEQDPCSLLCRRSSCLDYINESFIRVQNTLNCQNFVLFATIFYFNSKCDISVIMCNFVVHQIRNGTVINFNQNVICHC